MASCQVSNDHLTTRLSFNVYIAQHGVHVFRKSCFSRISTVTMDNGDGKEAKAKKIIRIDPSKLDSSVQNSLKNALAKLKG